jgi:hypothetical protein
MRRPIGEVPNPAGAEAAGVKAPETTKPRRGGVVFEMARSVRTGVELGTLLGVTALAMTKRRGGGTGDYETKDQRGTRKVKETKDAMARGDKKGAETAAGEVVTEVVRQLKKEVGTQDPRGYQRPQ